MSRIGRKYSRTSLIRSCWKLPAMAGLRDRLQECGRHVQRERMKGVRFRRWGVIDIVSNRAPMDFMMDLACGGGPVEADQAEIVLRNDHPMASLQPQALLFRTRP